MGIKKIGDRVRIFVAAKQLRKKSTSHRKQQRNLVRELIKVNPLALEIAWAHIICCVGLLSPSRLCQLHASFRIPSFATSRLQQPTLAAPRSSPFPAHVRQQCHGDITEAFTATIYRTRATAGLSTWDESHGELPSRARFELLRRRVCYPP